MIRIEGFNRNSIAQQRIFSDAVKVIRQDMTVSEAEHQDNSANDWKQAQKTYSGDAGYGEVEPVTIEQIVQSMERIEEQMLPKLSSTRVEAEAHLFKEFETVALEQTRLRDEIEATGEKIRALFKEYNELKPAYIQHCKEELKIAPQVEEPPARPFPVLRTYQDSYAQFQSKPTVAEQGQPAESGDEFQPSWAAKSWSTRKPPPERTATWKSSNDSTSWSKGRDWKETRYESGGQSVEAKEWQNDRRDSYKQPAAESSRWVKEDYKPSSAQSSVWARESYKQSSGQSSDWEKESYKPEPVESSDWGRKQQHSSSHWEEQTDRQPPVVGKPVVKHDYKNWSESRTWNNQEKQWAKTEPEPVESKGYTTWESREDDYQHVTYEPDVRSPEKLNNRRFMAAEPPWYRPDPRWDRNVEPLYEPETIPGRAPVLEPEYRFTSYPERRFIPAPPRHAPVRTEYGMNNALGGSGSLA